MNCEEIEKTKDKINKMIEECKNPLHLKTIEKYLFFFKEITNKHEYEEIDNKMRNKRKELSSF